MDQPIKSMRIAPLSAVLALAAMTAACGGGGESGTTVEIPPPPGFTVITGGNYIDVAGLAIVATNRVQFVADVIDAAFETVIQSSDVPGTYPCVYAGTVAFSKAGSSYTFTVTNCDTIVAGARVLLQSGSMRVDNPVIQTTSVGTSTVGYFLTSAAVTFNNAAFIESGATSIFAGAANLSSTVTSPTTAVARTTGASLTVQRAGRTDSYRNIDVTGNVTLFSGNSITAGSLTLSSPRAPGVLSFNANAPRATVSAIDNSQSILSTNNSVDFTLEFALAGAVQNSTTGSTSAGPLALAISRALQ